MGNITKDYNPPCRECGGKCCGYVAIEIEPPKTKQAVDHMRWYLLHENVNVFEENRKNWYVEFRTPCVKQKRSGLCSYYEKRPRICREHGNEEGECEYFAPPYTQYFKTVESFETYLDNKGYDWRYKR